MTGEHAVAVQEIPFATMIGIRATPGSAAHKAIAAPVHERPELLETLATALGEEPGHVVDLTSNRTIVELSGPGAVKVLRKVTPVGLHPRVFTVNRAITATVARTPVLLWKTDETTWRIMPSASFAEHLAFFLMDAMHEFDYALID